MSAKAKSIKIKRKTKRNNCDVSGTSGVTIPDIEDIFSDRETQVIRESLLHWFDRNQRKLPWRESPDKKREAVDKSSAAYEVWVSEIMLQQTRVQTVIDYYKRWMEKWPTLHDLAQASLEEVNDMWAGLGYYKRARYLLEGSKMVANMEGGFPKTVGSLRKIPGVGEYTAGAIASIAFKEVVPVVDGNVIRVLARLKAISANPKETSTVKLFWKLAGQLVDPSRPGDFNQSMMELGATLCTPLNPNCIACPVIDHCHAYALSKKDDTIGVTNYPAKTDKLKQRKEISFVSVVEIIDCCEKGKFLMVKRPDNGLLAGLWEFPTVKVEKEADLRYVKEEVEEFLAEKFGLDIGKNGEVIQRNDVGKFVHIFSHIRLSVHVEHMVVRVQDQMFGVENRDWKCVDSAALGSMGLTSGVRKVYRMVQKYKETNLNSTDLPVSGRKKRERTS